MDTLLSSIRQSFISTQPSGLALMLALLTCTPRHSVIWCLRLIIFMALSTRAQKWLKFIDSLYSILYWLRD